MFWSCVSICIYGTYSQMEAASWEAKQCSFASHGSTIDTGLSSDLYVELIFLYFVFFLLVHRKTFPYKHLTLIFGGQALLAWVLSLLAWGERFDSNPDNSPLVFPLSWEDKTKKKKRTRCQGLIWSVLWIWKVYGEGHKDGYLLKRLFKKANLLNKT